LEGGVDGWRRLLGVGRAHRVRGRLLRRHGGGRPVGGFVRRVVDRGAGLLGGAGASRPDRLRHRRNLAPYGQPYDRNDSLAKLRAASPPGPPILRYDRARWRTDADGWMP